ncbi:MAG: TMEM175 family protein [Bacteroidia bacterium]|nr:TMEM175 family protein [Bacteroidia bacterium]
MNKNRLEAFSDGVIAIIITIMVLELKVPHNPTWQSYLDAYPIFVSYALSFVLVGLYWSNHHHLFHTVSKVNNKILWLNMFTLFWQSLIPFATAAMGENSFTSIPVTVYALLLVLAAVSYMFLVNALCSLHGANSAFYKAYKGHRTIYISMAVHTSAAIISLIGFPKIAFTLIAVTVLLWFVPNHIISRNKPTEE